MRSTKQIRTQLEAAYTLMEGDTTTIEKFEKIKTLLLGINPTLDKKLTAAGTSLNHLQAALNSDIIHITGHALPELTPADKKRKKLLALFITSWKSLKSEISRVQGYYDNIQTGEGSTVASMAKTGLFAKGPLGLITMAAIVIVGVGLFLRQSTTVVSIENRGCPPLVVPAKLPFSIPGFKLPQEPIASGAPVMVTLPKLAVDIRATSSSISATILGQTGSYSLPARVDDVLFDQQSLLNQTTTLKLGSSAGHNLVVKCK